MTEYLAISSDQGMWVGMMQRPITAVRSPLPERGNIPWLANKPFDFALVFKKIGLFFSASDRHRCAEVIQGWSCPMSWPLLWEPIRNGYSDTAYS